MKSLEDRHITYRDVYGRQDDMVLVRGIIYLIFLGIAVMVVSALLWLIYVIFSILLQYLFNQ